jgi:hypothetical protein
MHDDDQSPKWRYRAHVRKMYQDGRMCWAFFILDMSLPAGSFRVVEANVSPDWCWNDAMTIGLRARAVRERKELGRAR